MKIKTILAASVAMCFVAGTALAQTCAAPFPITSNSNGSGDTCSASNPFPAFPGGIASPQNDVVFSFTAVASANATISIDSAGSPLVPGFVVMNPCDPVGGNIVAAASAVGTVASASVSGLTAGTEYFVVVTTDPGAGAAADNCGTFNYTVTGELPVELQSFSVD